jgi:hypothetical protein
VTEPAAAATLDYAAYWAAAEPVGAYMARADRHVELWQALIARAHVPDAIAVRIAAAAGPWRMLVLSEHWCGDAVHTLPLLARIAAAVPNVEVRVVSRDANPALMDAHLTDGKRSIPLVLLLDDAFRVRGRWGPRPASMQAWYVREVLPLPRPDRFPLARRWYAHDRGRTTLDEIAALVEVAAAQRDRAA